MARKNLGRAVRQLRLGGAVLKAELLVDDLSSEVEESHLYVLCALVVLRIPFEKYAGLIIFVNGDRPLR